MPAWASVAEARDVLRRFLNDGPEDRPVKNKLVVGTVDGVNQIFFTFDDRIVTGTIVFSYNLVEQPAGIIVEEDLVQGRFKLSPAPDANTEVRARYYWQLFLDSDLDDALALAVGEIHETDDITTIAPGFKNAALHYAASFAYTKQYSRWIAQRSSEKFLLLEAPVENGGQSRASDFKSAADMYYKRAVELRDSFYTRHGRREAPAVGSYKPLIGPTRVRR